MARTSLRSSTWNTLKASDSSSPLAANAQAITDVPAERACPGARGEQGGAERFAIASEARSDEPLSRRATIVGESSPARKAGPQGRAVIA